MGHSIDAIIGHKPIEEAEAKRLGLAVIYESEFAIIPLIEENIRHFEQANSIRVENFGEEIHWDCSSVLLMAQRLGFKKYVIATLSGVDFLGSYYEGHNKQHHELHIELALHHLAVPKKNNSAFWYLNLDDHRNAEFYYLAQGVVKDDAPNIIKGTILYPDYNKEA
ncbi:MAG: hypothetical protein AAFV95_02810 [Bacteroidota bacterium]